MRRLISGGKKLLKNEDQKISLMKLGAAIASVAAAVAQAGVDVWPGSGVDELIVRVALIGGLFLGVAGARDALGKIGKK